MKVYTIKGLYLGSGKQNPTYFGTLKDCIRYANNNSQQFTFYGEDVKICVGDTVVAIQKWNKKQDEIGDYWEAEEWQILRGASKYGK